jgi:hypothetical protein
MKAAMHFRSASTHNDDEDGTESPPLGPPGIHGQLSINTHMATTTLSSSTPYNLTNAELDEALNDPNDAALFDYEEDTKMLEPCKKHPECLHAGGNRHPGRCIWYDEDIRKRCVIPDDAPGWTVVPKAEKKAELKPEPKQTRSTEPKQTRSTPVATGSKKRKAPSDFDAAQAEVTEPCFLLLLLLCLSLHLCVSQALKATKAAEAAEAAAKRAKIEADEKLVAAAKREKERLRREASAKRREAEKIRLLAEKKAREEEAEADEMERMAAHMSQTYY